MTSSQQQLSSNGQPRAIGPFGTIARVLVGLALLAAGLIVVDGWITWRQLALGLVGIPGVLVLAQLTRTTWTSEPLVLTDHFATCVNCAILAVLLVPSATRDATLVFLGASLLVAALRGYGGCESLAVSNWLPRRNDQVGCLIFSPVDHLEARRGLRPHQSRS